MCFEVEEPIYDEESRQIVESFRKIAKSHAKLFSIQRDHIHELLDGRHNLSSGIFKEGLLKDFLTTVLPRAVSVDSGFIYGFDAVSNSKQIDVLIWDSMRYSAVYKTNDFVIVPPESVIAAIAVKSKFGKRDIENGLDNLLSISPIEIKFRNWVNKDTGKPMYEPILKIFFSFRDPKTEDSALKAAAQFFVDTFSQNEEFATEMYEALVDFNPIQPNAIDVMRVERIIPKLLISVGEKNYSLIQGWGPPDRGQKTYGPAGLKRLPYYYSQKNKITTPLEKMMYEILTSVYLSLNTQGWSLVSAWGDFQPVEGARGGDAMELDESKSAPLLDPKKLAGYKSF